MQNTPDAEMLQWEFPLSLPSIPEPPLKQRTPGLVGSVAALGSQSLNPWLSPTPSMGPDRERLSSDVH